jgi:hypothetical protein
MAALERHFADCAPPVPRHTSELEGELAFVIAEAERQAGSARLRSRFRLAIGGFTVVGALSVGTAAAGAAGIIPWFETAPSHGVVTTSTGSECRVTFGVKAIDDPDHPVVGSTGAAAVAAAEEFLEGFDVSRINVEDATRGLPPRATVGSEAGPAESIEEYETNAVMVAVQKRVDADLAQQGLPTTAVSVSMARSCDGGQK